MIHHKRSK